MSVNFLNGYESKIAN